MAEWDRENLAWAAGLYDGEGCTSVYAPTKTLDGPRKGRTRIRMTMAQVSPDILHRFEKAVGVGTILGPRRQTKNQNEYWIWSVERFEPVQHVICQLWPWLSRPKKDQIQRSLQAYLADQKIKRDRTAAGLTRKWRHLGETG